MKSFKVFCKNCKWCNDVGMGMFVTGQNCFHPGIVSIDYVDGKPRSGTPCSKKNHDGGCSDYERRVTWWGRIKTWLRLEKAEMI